MKMFFTVKNVIFIGLCIVFVVIATNIIRNIIEVWQRHYIIDQAEKELSRVEEENRILKSQLENVNRSGFIEEEARNKLFYIKPGEQIVYVPTKEEKVAEVEIIRLSPWREWVGLFF